MLHGAGGSRWKLAEMLVACCEHCDMKKAAFVAFRPINLLIWLGIWRGTPVADLGIINLAVNARDAMPNGGTLTIRTGNVRQDQELRHTHEVMPPGDYVMIRVKDTGIGISKENIARIFDPFFSTKELVSGTGLGLSTVYGIVKQTGGFIFVDSAPSQGAAFEIYLLRHHATNGGFTARIDSVEEAVLKDLTGHGTI